MSINKPIQITMFGGCSLTYEGKTLDGETVCSKRIWTLVEYLITYRFRCVAQDELIDLIYPDDSSKTPKSALKTLIHRARMALEGLNGFDGKEVIIKCSGGYRWNPEIPVEIDTDCFEKIMREASLSHVDEETGLQLRIKAIDLYRGDFLPGSTAEIWAMSITTYFHFLYMNLVHTVLSALKESERYNDVVTIAKKAISIDPYDESLHVDLILALKNTNQIQAARIQYENMTKLFYSELGVSPSKELQALYKKLINSNNGVETDIDIIVSFLKENEGTRGAFFCEYEFFVDVYRLEARAAARDGRPIHVCLLNINGKDGGALPKKTRNVAMQRLEECIKRSLRKGDVCSRYSISQFILLLPLTSYENSGLVLDRIVHRFRRENARLPAVVTYSIKQLEVELK